MFDDGHECDCEYELSYLLPDREVVEQPLSNPVHPDDRSNFAAYLLLSSYYEKPA